MSTARRWANGAGARHRDCKTFIYLTIGTGIGGGAYVEGNLLHGLLHPEMGHITVKHDKEQTPLKGSVHFTVIVWKGWLRALPSKNAGDSAAAPFRPEHPAWELEADYIAQALANYAFTLSPQRIIVGGGVGSVPHLMPKVQKKTRELHQRLHSIARHP
jgi:fructokinase